jgi:hypothetical protein
MNEGNLHIFCFCRFCNSCMVELQVIFIIPGLNETNIKKCNVKKFNREYDSLCNLLRALHNPVPFYIR